LSKIFELTILGSGSATPTLSRNPASQILNIQDQLMLIDCGEGTQIALRKNKIKFQRINQIFISHLHGDHYLGLPGLLSTFNLLGRNNSLDIYGPSELEEIINFHFKVSGTLLKYPINFFTVKANSKKLLFENKTLQILAFPLKHRIETYGFLFEEKPKLRHINSEATKELAIPYYQYNKIKHGADYIVEETGKIIPNHKLTLPASPSYKFAYCSDTAYNPKIIKWIEGANILFHETTFMEKDRELAHKTYHSTTLEAAEIAKQANVEKLIIGHYSARYLNPEILVKECKTVFNNTEGTADGQVFSIL
jgi:ribonuclease Z